MKTASIIAALAIVAAIGIWISGLYVERNTARANVETEKANVTKQKARADGFKSSLDSCISAAAEQSAAVLKLKADNERLDRELAEARKAAAAKAKPLYERANEVASRKPAANEDPCRWASNLVDEQLRLERAK